MLGSLKTQNELSKKIFEIASIPPTERTDKQITILKEYLQRSDIMILRENTDMTTEVKKIVLKAINCFELEFYPRGAALYHHDEKAEKLFVLVKGSIRNYEMRSPEVVEEEYKNFLNEFNNENSQLHNERFVDGGMSPVQVSSPKTMSSSQPSHRGSSIKQHNPGTKGTNGPNVAQTSAFSFSNVTSSTVIASPGKRRGGGESHGDSPQKANILTTITVGNALKKFQKQSNPLQRVKLSPLKIGTPHLDRQEEVEQKASSFSLHLNLNLRKRPSLFVDPLAYRSANENVDEQFFRTFEDRSFKYFKGPILKVRPGACFSPCQKIGEEAFLSHEKITNGCPIAVEDSWVLVMKYKDFESIYEKIIASMNEKVDFLARAFRTFSRDVVTKVGYFFDKVALKHDQFVYKRGDPADSLYIIFKGEIEISRELSVDRNEEKAKRLLIVNNTTTFKPVKLTEGEIFGGEVFTKEKVREYNAIPLTLTLILYKISKKNIETLERPFPEFTAYLAQLSLKKIGHQQNMLENFRQKHGIYKHHEKFVHDRDEVRRKSEQFVPHNYISTAKRVDILSFQASRESLKRVPRYEKRLNLSNLCRKAKTLSNPSIHIKVTETADVQEIKLPGNVSLNCTFDKKNGLSVSRIHSPFPDRSSPSLPSLHSRTNSEAALRSMEEFRRPIHGSCIEHLRRASEQSLGEIDDKALSRVRSSEKERLLIGKPETSDKSLKSTLLKDLLQTLATLNEKTFYDSKIHSLSTTNANSIYEKNILRNPLCISRPKGVRPIDSIFDRFGSRAGSPQ